MKDAQMIEWLRRMAALNVLNAEAASRCEEAADRLEALTRPGTEAPVTPGRLEEIRDSIEEEVAHAGRHNYAISEADARVRDLLAALDHVTALYNETCAALQDAQSEQGAFDQGFRAGVAAALEAVRLIRADRHLPSPTLDLAIGAVEAACGPALAPPHLLCLARMRKLEETMTWIARHACVAPGPSYEDIKKEAEKALAEGRI